MAAMEFLCSIIGVNTGVFSVNEKKLLEADLFTRCCDELKEIYRMQYKTYFKLMKYNIEMENAMLEAIFIRSVIQDILTTGEYSLEGIANYTQVPEEIIYDLVLGLNLEPSLPLSRKIIELHRMARPTLYRDIMNKIVTASSG